MRIRSLDSLRGVAAFTVVLYHYKQILTASTGVRLKWIDVSPLRILFSGHGAVMIFFALSGFVLFLSFKDADRFGVRAFFIKRFMRIYPPFAVAIMFSALLAFLLQPNSIPLMRDEFGSLLDWRKPTLGLIPANLAMTDNERWQSLDPPMWSLVHELRISLIFPLLAICVKRNWPVSVMIALAISILSAFLNRFHPHGSALRPFATLQYLFLFVCGATISLNMDKVVGFLRRLNFWQRIACWIVSLLLISMPAKSEGGLFAAFAAISIVGLCLQDETAKKILEHRFATWLGKVSYSIYLLHVPIAYALVHAFFNRVPLVLILCLAAVVSLAAADIFYRFVELPSIDAGRRIAKAFTSRRLPISVNG